MALTKVQIISNAINLLNKGPITSISDGGVFSSAAESTFDYLYPSIISKSNWRFATKLIQLSLLVDEPIVDNWTKIFQLPPDYLALHRTYPYTLDFTIYENKKLYTNLSEMKLEYRFLPAVTLLPDYFVEYLTYELAANLGLSGAASESLYTKLVEKANKRRREATATDAKSHPNTAIISNPIIDARFDGNYRYYREIS